MQRGNKVIALEVSAIEGKNALHGVDVHDGDEPRVIDLDALDFIVVHDAFPHGIDRRHPGSRDRDSSMLVTSRNTSSSEKPSPFRSAGRVATFQNSAMF